MHGAGSRQAYDRTANGAVPIEVPGNRWAMCQHRHFQDTAANARNHKLQLGEQFRMLTECAA